jgi:fatty-acyl-CoA synthase
LDIQMTPTRNTVAFRAADFANLAEALDYAALGETGCNFYTARGVLYAAVSYGELRAQAKVLARRLHSLGLERGSRVVLVAETSPDFHRFFFACQYAGLVPVPVPVPLSLSSRDAYVDLLRGMVERSGADVAMAPSDYVEFLREAVDGLELAFVGDAGDFDALIESSEEPRRSSKDELAYLQYTSGSTRFPRGVMISQTTVMNNLAGIVRDGVKVRADDRAVSWLPFYHDMGLVGLVLAPMASQLSVDYLATRDFAVRPRQWLNILSKTRGTISFSPPFGFELCARRLRESEAEALDLSAWRVAGVGAEMINPDILNRFAQVAAPSGFSADSFTPCYGMAECALAISFNPLGRGMNVDVVDAAVLATEGRAEPVRDSATATSRFVDCGKLLPEFEVEVRDARGGSLADREIGNIFLRGPSVMSGYFRDEESSLEALSADGWLNTGDVGYLADKHVFVTGRSKDMIIINGRNVWPQDLEHLAHQQPEVRSGDCLAFSAPGADGEETAVMVVQCREKDALKRADLIDRLQTLVRVEVGVDCQVELVPLHTLPRTSSGKLSRSKARLNYIEARDQAPVPSSTVGLPTTGGVGKLSAA